MKLEDKRNGCCPKNWREPIDPIHCRCWWDGHACCYCDKHYWRFKKHGDPDVLIVKPGPDDGLCVVAGCKKKHYCKGYCIKHYRRVQAHGDPAKTLRPRYPDVIPKHRKSGYTMSLRRFLYREQDGLCALCGKPLGDNIRSLHVDHDIPLVAGGTNDPENLQLTHPVCNMKKGTRLIAPAFSIQKSLYFSGEGAEC